MTTAGAVEGDVVGRGVHRFRGVPFAEPPTGARWLQAPVPRSPWDGVRPADRPGDTAPQVAGFGVTTPRVSGDDYLTAAVWSPDPGAGAASGRGLPVLVWIHGGGSTMGSNDEPLTAGTAFAEDGIVVIALNYRLGVEGFATVDGAPPNRAVLDWLLGLQWVQENAAAFGGDPADITLAGQSAGSAAVLTLLSLPQAQGLFHRVIAMSGVPHNTPDLAGAAAFSDRMAEELGAPMSVDGLRSVPLERRLEVQTAMSPVGPRLDGGFEDAFASMVHDGAPIGVVVDGETVPVRPVSDAGVAVGAGVPLMIGATRGEADAVGTMMAPGLALDDARRILGQTGIGADAVTSFITDAALPSPSHAVGRAVTDLTFRVPSVRLAERRLARPGASDTHVYDFAWESPSGIGAVHGIDMPFVFGTLDADDPALPFLVGTAAPRDLAATTHAAYVRFITKGDPGWAPYDTDARPVMVFDAPTSAVEPDPHRPGREAFGPLR